MAGHSADKEPRTWDLLREDWQTYAGALGEGGLWVTALHRLRASVEHAHPKIAQRPLRGALTAATAVAAHVFGIHISPHTRLGRRLRIWHNGGITLHARSIGDDVHLRPNTACGSPGNLPDTLDNWPTIGDRCDIGAGACVLGSVEVDDDAMVGANSLVLEDVPKGEAMLGVPGRLWPQRPVQKAARRDEDAVPESGPRPARILGQHDQNPTDVSLAKLIVEDFQTHGGRVYSPGFWALLVHRLGNRRMAIERKALRAPMTLAYLTAFECVRLVWGIDLSYVVKVGRRVYIDGRGPIMIGAESIGDDVRICHSVVVGVLRRDAPHDKPTIGHRVELGPRVCVVGHVSVGDDTFVCANSVVPANIPPGSFVLGVPGRITKLAKHIDSPPS